MDQHSPRRRAGSRNPRRSRRSQSSLASRPDRIALWAVLMAVVAMLAAAASARAASGGIGEPGADPAACPELPFGERQLALGDCGDDVKTLNWILNSTRQGRAAPLAKSFEEPTESGVRAFQQRRGLDSSGVVDRRTRRKLLRSMRTGLATWYGPGFYGNQTACGVKLTRRTVGIAHRKLPCGSKVTVRYGGELLRTRVIDRGPYAHGARWDLTNGARKQLGFLSTDEIRAAVIR